MERIQSFAPIVGKEPKILILGSMPSVASLHQMEYYGHGRNQFWRIMGDLFDFDGKHSYETRKENIISQGIAVWDVFSACERKGSLDQHIKEPEYNDIVGFVKEHPSIRVILLNGKKAADAYRKQFQKMMPDIKAVLLGSTSPAYTIPYEEKLSQWRIILEILKDNDAGLHESE